MISHATLQSAFVSLFATLAAMSLQPAEAADFVELKREKYQKEMDGKKVDLYTIRNRGGMVVKITNWGAKVQQIPLPDRNGVLGDVALGYETIDDLIGRLISYAGLIYAGNTSDPARTKFYGDVQERITAASSHLLFFTLELNRIEEDVLQAAMREQGRDWQVRLVNLFEVLDPQDVFRRTTGVKPEDYYNVRLARGWTIGLA